MRGNKPVLIVEHSLNGLQKINESVNNKGEKQYILSGVFTEFDIMNRNERIYTADKFLPHLNEMITRKTQLGVVYGEFDHPDVFDTSLTRISHTIEKAVFNQTKNRVDGEIRLLNTQYGKEAKALIDDNCPIFVSSRAAGITESNGTVTVKKLFTYDAVADPGFGSARMENKSLNESLSGFDKTKNQNFRIYDISDESKINELFTMNQNDYVTKNQMVEYSEYLKTEIAKVKRVLNESVLKGGMSPEKVEKFAELYENMQEQQTKISQYLDYLAETVQIVVNENQALKVKTEKLVEHNDYLAENLEKTIKYSEYLAEQLDNNIDYSEYIAETLDKGIDFTEYIAEHVNKNIEFSDYLAESIEKSIDYSEYIAEHLDKNIAYAEYIAENLDSNIQYSEYLAENLDSNIAYSEYLAENLDNNIAYAEYIAESVDNNIAYAEYIAEHVDNSIAYSEYIAENLQDTQAYTNYLAEGLDNTLEAIKTGKLNEYGQGQPGQGQAQVPNMKVDDVDKYYDDDEDEDEEEAQGQPVQGQPVQGQPVQGQPVQGQPVQGQPVQGQPIQGQPVQGQPGAQIDAQTGQPLGSPNTTVPPMDAMGMGQPGMGEMAGIGAQPGMTGMEQPMGMPTSVEGQPMAEVEMVPGATVAVEGQTGEILAYNPQSKLVVIQLADGASNIEVHESKVMIIGNKLLKNEDSLKSYISGLITETKKRKASETAEPHYLTFLTEKNKNIWRTLSSEDKEKITHAINESNAPIYNESDVIVQMQKALTVEKVTLTDLLLENMPADIKEVWTKIDESHKQSVLNQGKLYPNLNTAAKIESFWNSRGLERYLSLNESKKILNESRVIDGSSLSDEQIEKFINKIKNLG